MTVTLNFLHDRNQRLIKEKRALVERGLYPVDFVGGVLRDLSPDEEIFTNANIGIAMLRLGRNGVKIREVGPAGMRLKVVDEAGLLDVIEHYQRSGKVASYTVEDVRSVIGRKKDNYLQM